MTTIRRPIPGTNITQTYTLYDTPEGALSVSQRDSVIVAFGRDLGAGEYADPEYDTPIGYDWIPRGQPIPAGSVIVHALAECSDWGLCGVRSARYRARRRARIDRAVEIAKQEHLRQLDPPTTTDRKKQLDLL